MSLGVLMEAIGATTDVRDLAVVEFARAVPHIPPQTIHALAHTTSEMGLV